MLSDISNDDYDSVNLLDYVCMDGVNSSSSFDNSNILFTHTNRGASYR